jgi:rubrerythrin
MTRHAVKYICSAHHIETVQPGRCPICGKTLQRIDV